jgi:hypothetical protein
MCNLDIDESYKLKLINNEENNIEANVYLSIHIKHEFILKIYCKFEAFYSIVYTRHYS